MDSPPSTDAGAAAPALRLLSRDGAPAAPREWQTVWVEASVPPAEWEGAELLRNGRPLALGVRRLGGRTAVVAEWPRSGCGRYALVLRHAGGEHRAEVEVFPEKIGPDRFARLLEDLETRLPASVALALQRAGGLAGVHLLPPGASTLAEEVARLRRAVHGTDRRPGIAAVLDTLARDPHRVLRAVEAWVPADRARRIHPARLRAALSRPGNLGIEGRPVRVPDARVQSSEDVYENRLVRTLVGAVERRLRRLAPVLRAPRHAVLAAEVDEMARTLRRARRRAAFLDEVGELAHAPDRLTMVLLKRPPYRAALESYLELHRRVSTRLESPALEAPLENLPALYQTWGTLEVVVALLGAAAALGYGIREQRLVTHAAGGLFVRVLPGNRPAVVLAHPETAVEVKLYPERAYRRNEELRSLTYPQRPDVAVEVSAPGRRARVYLFDPKYKLDGEPLEQESSAGKPMKVDIDKMHAYRDAIRDESGERVVEYAAILYPGPEVLYDLGIAALSAVPGEAEAMERQLETVLRQALGGA